MNIQKSELLFLDKNNLQARQNLAATKSVPAFSSQSADAGMNALTFLGMQNLMSNPNLALKLRDNEDGEENTETKNNAPAFKANYKNMAMAGALALATLGTGALTSCQEQTMTATIDMSTLNKMEEALQTLIKQNDANKPIWQNMLTYVQGLYNNSEDEAAFREEFAAYIRSMLNRLLESSQNNEQTNKDTKALIDVFLNEYIAGRISFEDLLSKINGVLDSIDGKLDNILGVLKEISAKQDKYGQEARDFYIQNNNNAKELIKATYMNVQENKEQNDRLDSLIILENKKYALADSLYKGYKEGNAAVITAINENADQIARTFEISNQIANAHAEDRNNKLMAALAQWMNVNHADNLAQYKNQQIMINLIEKYGPLIGGGSTTEIVDAIERFMAQEKAADEAAAEQRDIDTKAIINAINEVNTGIEKLGEKADKVLNKMDAFATVINNNGDKIKQAIDENTDILKAMSFDSPDLKVLINYTKELVDNSKKTNDALDASGKIQNRISEQIDELNLIAGKALTKDELEILWKQHDIDYKTYLNAIHAEDMGKADEAIELLKKGNKIAQDTYTLVANWAAKADTNAADYKEILNKIYEYLPELVCHCQCGDDVNKNEGIQDDINNLINGN